MPAKSPSALYRNIYASVRLVPPGFVTTYGRIAQLSGCSARTVGFALAALPRGSDVPWQRVINRLGAVSPRTDGEGNILQRTLLETEGLAFDAAQRIDLARYGWGFPQEVDALSRLRG